MGWTFGYSSKDDTIRNILSDGRFVDKTLVGNEFWTVMHSEQENTNVIVLFLLEKEGKSWGYKVMDEGQHPYYYKCPKSFLRLAPVLSEDWRKGVQAYHDKKAQSRRARHEAYTSLGLVKVKGALGGIYYE